MKVRRFAHHIEAENSPWGAMEVWFLIRSVAVKVLGSSYCGLVSRCSSFPHRSIHEDLHKSNVLPLVCLDLLFVALVVPVFARELILQQLQRHPKEVYHSDAYPVIPQVFFYPV